MPASSWLRVRSGIARVRQPFLEPMVGVWLLVERGDLGVPGGPVQVDRLGQPPVGFQAEHGYAPLTGVLLEFGQNAPSDTQAAGAGGDPHPFELGRLGAVELQGPAADRFAMNLGQEQETGWFDEL